MFALDADLSPFYNALAEDDPLYWARNGAGRLLAAPSVFEDLVRTLCSTNCAFSATRRMVAALVRIGDGAFPTPQRILGLGEEALVTVGFGPDSAYLAIGDDGLETIKAVMGKSVEAASEELPPAQISLALAPLLKLASQQEDANPAAAMLAESLKDGGVDHLRITVKPIENGVQYELEGEEGIITLIGSAAKLAQAAGGAGGL